MALFHSLWDNTLNWIVLNLDISSSRESSNTRHFIHNPHRSTCKKVDRLQFALLSPTNIIQVTVLAVTRQISFILKKMFMCWIPTYQPISTSIYLKNFPEAEIYIFQIEICILLYHYHLFCSRPWGDRSSCLEWHCG